MKWFIYMLLLLLPLSSLADDFDDAEEIAVTQAKAFIKQYPVIENNVDEIGLVNLWQRIQGLQNLISIWDNNREAFDRDGADEIQSSQIRQRIQSHKSFASYVGNDEQVKLLVDIIQLHANIADRYMNEEITYSPYADIAGFAVLSGRYIAKSIWIRYGKCLRNKDPGKKQTEKTDDKLLM